jgi:hypothetical protein
LIDGAWPLPKCAALESQILHLQSTPVPPLIVVAVSAAGIAFPCVAAASVVEFVDMDLADIAVAVAAEVVVVVVDDDAAMDNQAVVAFGEKLDAVHTAVVVDTD